MDLIYTDTSGKELGEILDGTADIEVGNGAANDFEVTFKRNRWTGTITYGSQIFIPNTEFGGIVREIYTSTKQDSIAVRGRTWRGMMEKKIIQPESGQDYALANGELNAVLKEKVEAEFPDLFKGVATDTGKKVTNFQFDRYCSLHDGFVKMLKSAGYRLMIRYIQGERTGIGYVEVQAVPIQDYAEEEELSNDSDMDFTVDNNRQGVNHLICLGKGELKERIVAHLYVDQSGKISEKKTFSGIEEIVSVYENTGAEKDELVKGGTERLEELKNKAEYNMTLRDMDGEYDIGDIVGGRDYITGIYMKKPIGRKIWTLSGGTEKIEYKLEGES